MSSPTSSASPLSETLSSSSGGSSSSGTAFADGSTVTISSQALPNVSQFMHCQYAQNFNEDPASNTYDHRTIFYNCNHSDQRYGSILTESKSIDGNTYKNFIRLMDLHSNGYKPCIGVDRFHIFFCK